MNLIGITWRPKPSVSHQLYETGQLMQTIYERKRLPVLVRLPRELVANAMAVASDYISVIVVFSILYWLYFSMLPTASYWWLPVPWLVAYWREGLYPSYGLSPVDKLRCYVIGALFAAIVLMVIAPLLKAEYQLSYPLICLTALASAPVIFLFRVLLQRLLQSVGVWGRPVIILGAGTVGISTARKLLMDHALGLIPVAFFDDDVQKVGMLLAGLPVVGKISTADSYALSQNIEHAIIAIPDIDQLALRRLTSSEGIALKRIQYIPNLPGLPVEAIRTRSLSNILTFEIRNNLRLRRNQLLKRSIDLVVATVGSALCLPFLLAISLLVRFSSSGPVFYSQSRIGKDGGEFRIWKFRSMVQDADATLEAYLHKHPEMRQEWEANHKLANDPRITRVGHFLRATSLDELPQLYNVIRGEMSLVGPRPIVQDEIAKYGNSFAQYSLVRPGMTGYWQVSGRSETSYEHRVVLDEYYVRNWSVWFDILILLSTVRVVLIRRGAY